MRTSKIWDKFIDILKEDILEIRSPTKEFFGKYSCENCKFHEDCICVVCEDGNTVVCTKQHRHVDRHGTCKHFKKRR